MPMPDQLAPGPATQLRIEIKGPEHSVAVGKLLEWLERGSGRTPKEYAVKCELQELLLGRR